MTPKLASLHSGLVARKGEAMPAVSHALFSYVDAPHPSAREEDRARAAREDEAAREDRIAVRRAWPSAEGQTAPGFAQPQMPKPVTQPANHSDAALDQEQPAFATPSAAERPTAVQTSAQAAPQSIASRSVEPKPDPKPESESERVPDEPDVMARHRMTLRLSHEQHHRLRLAAAIADQSLQHVLSEALDNHLNGLCACSLKDCACLAAATQAQHI